MLFWVYLHVGLMGNFWGRVDCEEGASCEVVFMVKARVANDGFDLPDVTIV